MTFGFDRLVLGCSDSGTLAEAMKFNFTTPFTKDRNHSTFFYFGTLEYIHSTCRIRAVQNVTNVEFEKDWNWKASYFVHLKMDFIYSTCGMWHAIIICLKTSLQIKKSLCMVSFGQRFLSHPRLRIFSARPRLMVVNIFEWNKLGHGHKLGPPNKYHLKEFQITTYLNTKRKLY